MKRLKKEKAITLVSLVITIVILLILAGISISTLTNTGIFEKAKEAKKASENAEKEQNKLLEQYREQLNKYMPEELTDDKINKVLSQTENTFLKDTNGNSFTLPAGFKVVVNDDTNNAKTVDKGIVVEDKDENEFVWVPVGKIYTDVERTNEKSKIIELKRCDFYKYECEVNFFNNSIEEDRGNITKPLQNLGNIIAKNITDFKNSISNNGGYYIGRYEAGVTGYDINNVKTENSNKEVNWTGYVNEKDKQLKAVSKINQQVWNYITQNKAAELSQNMYNSSKFTSDLINSYAWDTAITFIQECTGKTDYAMQISQNKSLAKTGTSGDNPCNIHDMSGNVVEWSTETSNNLYSPCIYRGGTYYETIGYAGFRYNDKVFNGGFDYGFRVILYL